MTDKILLGTFTNKEKLKDFYERLEKFYSLKKENTFIFSINESFEQPLLNICFIPKSTQIKLSVLKYKKFG